MKDKSKLHKKVITDKKGHRKTVWVKNENDEPKNKRLTSKDIYTEKVKEYKDILDKAPETPKEPKPSEKGHYETFREAMQEGGRTKLNTWYKIKGRPNSMIRLNSKGDSLQMINFNPNDPSMAVVVKLTKNNKVTKHRLGE